MNVQWSIKKSRKKMIKQNEQKKEPNKTKRIKIIIKIYTIQAITRN